MSLPKLPRKKQQEIDYPQIKPSKEKLERKKRKKAISDDTQNKTRILKPKERKPRQIKITKEYKKEYNRVRSLIRRAKKRGYESTISTKGKTLAELKKITSKEFYKKALYKTPTGYITGEERRKIERKQAAIKAAQTRKRNIQIEKEKVFTEMYANLRDAIQDAAIEMQDDGAVYQHKRKINFRYENLITLKRTIGEQLFALAADLDDEQWINAMRIADESGIDLLSEIEEMKYTWYEEIVNNVMHDIVFVLNKAKGIDSAIPDFEDENYIDWDSYED